MNNLKTLLQDADPLRHEAPHRDAARERVRQTILEARPVDRSTTSQRARLRLAATLAASMVIVALGYYVWAYGSTPILAAIRFEVRLAEDQPTPGLVVAQIADTTRLIYLHPEIVVSNDDIARSWVFQDGPGFSVAVEFLPSGAERMRQATTAHVGRPVAILIDGRVVATPTVRAPIGDSAVINGVYTQAQAERIVNGIDRR
jgi:hypothetical protein